MYPWSAIRRYHTPSHASNGPSAWPNILGPKYPRGSWSQCNASDAPTTIASDPTHAPKIVLRAATHVAKVSLRGCTSTGARSNMNLPPSADAERALDAQDLALPATRHEPALTPNLGPVESHPYRRVRGQDDEEVSRLRRPSEHDRESGPPGERSSWVGIDGFRA